MSRVLAVLACLAATAQPVDTTVWDGDWGVYDWEIHAGGDWGDSDVETVPAPGGRDGVAGEFTVRQDADDDAERAEASATQRDTGGYPDQEWYYEWSTYVPALPNEESGWGDDPEEDWTDLTQWMDTRAECSPPLQIAVEPGDRPRLALGHEINRQEEDDCEAIVWESYPLGELAYDRWMTFDVHIRFSEDPEVGFVEVWLDGRLALPLTHLQTLDPGSDGVYLEQAFYRNDRTGTGLLYHAGMRRHTEHVT